jgi:hypothetical protein
VRDVLADRGRYIAAALTIARAYGVGGMPDRPPPFASFDAWSDKVRGSLMWLRQADPVETVAEPAVADLASERRGEVFAAIAVTFPNGLDFGVRDLVAASGKDETLRAALEGVARGKGDAPISNLSLGWWLRRNANRITGGFKLVPGERSESQKGRWRMMPVKGASA